MRLPLLIFCIIALNRLQSQSFSSHSIALTPTTFPHYNFNDSEYVSRIKDRFPAGHGVMVNDYINYSLAGLKAFFNSNEIYTNWPEATDFVKRVFQKTVPQQFNASEVKIYIVRSPDMNAYCMENGNITVTTGFLAFMNNEAELASTLAHEYGHYYSNHNFTGYVERMEMEKNRLAGRSGTLKRYLKQSRNSERIADTFSFNFMTKNGYSPEAIVNDFENFEKHTSKYKLLVNYRKVPSYLSTHPSNSERINSARKLSSLHKDHGRLFQVDSAAFASIKKRALDECIFLLYDQLRFDECLELAFLQYLYHPDDEFYTYFILESLRGKLASEKYSHNLPFITSCYQLSKLKVPKFDPYCKTGANYYDKKSEYRFSVFNCLLTPIFRQSEKDISAMKAPELKNRDTIPFFTYKEAFTWFSNKIPSGNPVFNSIRQKLERSVVKDSAEKSNSELAISICSRDRYFKDFPGQWENLDKGMAILNSVRFYKLSGMSYVNFHNLEMEMNYYHEFNSCLSKNELMDIISKDKLNFKEHSKIDHIASFNYSVLKKSIFSNSADVDFLEICPEFVFQSMKNKLEAIFFIDLYLTEDKRSVAYIYTVDIRNKRISQLEIPISLGYNSTEEVVKKILAECESMIKN